MGLGLGLALLLIVLAAIALGLMVVNAKVQQREWRRAVAAGEPGVLHQALEQAFDVWRTQRPPRGYPPSDWQALQTAEVIAADRERARVSLIATPDYQVVEGARRQVGTALDVARRAAVAMAERLLYEVPYVRFDAVQVDVLTEYRQRDGEAETEYLLTTQVDRETAAETDWDFGEPREILDGWQTRDIASGDRVDPDRGALIAAPTGGRVAEGTR